MNEIALGRDLIRKAVQMTTIISKDKTYEDKLWKIACDYVRKAKEVIPVDKRNTLSEFEQRVLRNGVPDRSEFCFFDEDEQHNSDENNQESTYPPKPSTWDGIYRASLSVQEQNQELKRQIYTLEHEKSTLEEYKEMARELRSKYDQLDEIHESYRKRTKDEQHALQTEMRKMMEKLEDATEDKQESQFLLKELEKMKEKIGLLHQNKHEEMTRLCVEIDTINHERQILSEKLEYTQTKLVKSMNEIEDLKYQIQNIKKYLCFYCHQLQTTYSTKYPTI